MKRLCCSFWLPSLVARPCPGAASYARSQSRRFRIFASMCIMLMFAIPAQAFSPTLSPPTPLFSFFSSFSPFFFQNCVLFFLVCLPSLSPQYAAFWYVGLRCVVAWGSLFFGTVYKPAAASVSPFFFPLCFASLCLCRRPSFPLPFFLFPSYGPKLQWTLLLLMQLVACNVQRGTSFSHFLSYINGCLSPKQVF